jgi:hypothetical protein
MEARVARPSWWGLPTLSSVRRSGDDRQAVCWSGIFRRFHPKRRASIDQAPGPVRARAAPRTANINQWHGLAAENTFHNAPQATSTPVIGVQRPASNSIPRPAVSSSMRAVPSGRVPRSPSIPDTTSPTPAAKRMRRSPTPGAPRANVEKSRRMHQVSGCGRAAARLDRRARRYSFE